MNNKLGNFCVTSKLNIISEIKKISVTDENN